MGLKRKIGIFVLACAVIGIALFAVVQIEPYSTEAVMDSVWNKYNVQSTMIGGESIDGKSDPTLWVDVYGDDDTSKAEKYLEKNLSLEDLGYYEIDVFLYASPEESF